MTQWLERQDAVNDRVHFLEWLKREPLGSLDDGKAGIDDDEDDEEELKEDNRFAPTIHPRLYRLAKSCPFRSTPLYRVQQEHLAFDFLSALRKYTKTEYPHVPYVPRPSDTYNVYKLMKVEQPWNPFVSNEVRFEKVRAIAAVAPRGRQGPVPGVFDPILVIENRAKFRTRDVNEPLAGKSDTLQ